MSHESHSQSAEFITQSTRNKRFDNNQMSRANLVVNPSVVWVKLCYHILRRL